MQSCTSTLIAGTSLWSMCGLALSGARVRVGPNTRARLAELILVTEAY